MSDYLDSNGLQRVWGKFKENISSYKTIENTSIASFTDGSNLPLKSLTADITAIQDLHGYDYPWVGGSGANKWDEEWEVGTFNPTTGADSGGTNNIRSKNKFPILGDTSYYVKTSANLWIMFFDADQNVITDFNPQGVEKYENILNYYNKIMTTPTNARYMRFYTVNTYGGTYKNDIAINYPSSVTTYSPYSNECPIIGWDECKVTVADDVENPTVSNVYTIDLDGTRYGGYVDLVSGLLTINKLGINVMSQEKRGWQIGSKSVCYRITLPQTATSCASNQTHGAISNMMTEQLAYYGVSRPNDLDGISFAIDTSGVALAVYDTDLTLSEQQMISKYTDLFAVYPLATPLTYQLSKQQIRSLVGENNIFASTGAIKKVEYQPDNIVGEIREDIDAIKIPIVIANVVSKSGDTVTLDKSLYQIIELAEAGYTVRVIDKVSSQIERFFYDLNHIYNSDQWKVVEFQNIMPFYPLSVRFKTLTAEDDGGDTYTFDIVSETGKLAPTPTSSDVNKSLKVNSDLDPYWSN